MNMIEVANTREKEVNKIPRPNNQINMPVSIGLLT